MAIDDEDTIFDVVVNGAEQFSIWLRGHATPDGWRSTGFTGTREACCAHIDVIWGDMRPRRLRDFLAGPAVHPAWQAGPGAPAPVHRLIADHARVRPDAPAVIQGDETVSFAALDAEANRLARHLLALGLAPEMRVGVALERSPAMIVAFLAVLKAGGAFVPVDPGHPAERIAHVLGDAGVTLVLIERRLAARLPDLPGTMLVACDGPAPSAMPGTDPDVPVHPDQLAYLIYTSGSTGRPKGVAVAHGPLAAHCLATGDLYDMTPLSRELHFLSVSFDGAHERWMVPLAFGGSIVLRDQDLWSAGETLAAMGRHGVTNAGFPPRYLHQVAEWAEEVGSAPPVRLYSFGGEGMSPATFALVKRALRPQWLINGYGPTEAVISPLAWKVPASESFTGAYAPIGRAVGPRHAYILDERLAPVPEGSVGELFIGGDGLARGYHRRPGATAERFLPDPFAGGGGRMYRTGDLVRRREDGAIDYLGRRDQQVKLRGFRIELGEVEARLAELEAVSASAAALREGPGGSMLVGYVVPAAGAQMEPTALRTALARSLPDYMVPSRIVVLDSLPFTPNGKLDRAALPAPDIETASLLPPRTAMESDIADIWQEVLGLRAVGIDQNFFELGGNSLTALKVLSRLAGLFPDRGITIAQLFNHQTVAELAAAIAAGAAGEPEVVHMRRSGSRPMLYCFPGLLVSTREYAKLVAHLGPDQPATAFICYSLTQDKTRTASVEELAGRYADHIRRASGGVPCTLLGWSWGGILAYETARLLGTSVEMNFVGMLDVCALDAEFAVNAEVVLDPSDRAMLERRIAAWLGRTRMRAGWESLFARMDADVYTRFLAYVHNSKEDLPLDGPDIGSREHIFWTLIENAMIFRNYRMERFDCPIHAWIAEESIRRGFKLIDWRDYSNRVERVEVVPGTDHLNIVTAEAFHASFAASVEANLTGRAASRRQLRLAAVAR
ncbi:amino acid adenylation domain-containing protein [Chelatococcus sp. SYSU_G07232]|uniref:Amino acid adenylation domain-containing protein n=1 Tax=Chelatococcus albus TaxID=3047466 RepID=A0ABT7ABC2_9HYPH|nr:amino acid adenylation domain-containing protein [Chelatococcus sp. SYSU_G07232]MDJ1156672.1 amino acid adenylation domain-containing protein [Chelatococcus sp. SYSU_G07232]